MDNFGWRVMVSVLKACRISLRLEWVGKCMNGNCVFECWLSWKQSAIIPFPFGHLELCFSNTLRISINLIVWGSYSICYDGDYFKSIRVTHLIVYCDFLECAQGRNGPPVDACYFKFLLPFGVCNCWWMLVLRWIWIKLCGSIIGVKCLCYHYFICLRRKTMRLYLD